jgi:hypothetical protein
MEKYSKVNLQNHTYVVRTTHDLVFLHGTALQYKKSIFQDGLNLRKPPQNKNNYFPFPAIFATPDIEKARQKAYLKKDSKLSGGFVMELILKKNSKVMVFYDNFPKSEIPKLEKNFYNVAAYYFPDGIKVEGQTERLTSNTLAVMKSHKVPRTKYSVVEKEHKKKKEIGNTKKSIQELQKIVSFLRVFE